MGISWGSAEQGDGGFAPAKGRGTRVIHRRWAGSTCLQYLAFWTVQTRPLVSQVLSCASQALKPFPPGPSPPPWDRSPLSPSLRGSAALARGALAPKGGRGRRCPGSQSLSGCFVLSCLKTCRRLLQQELLGLFAEPLEKPRCSRRKAPGCGADERCTARWESPARSPASVLPSSSAGGVSPARRGAQRSTLPLPCQHRGPGHRGLPAKPGACGRGSEAKPGSGRFSTAPVACWSPHSCPVHSGAAGTQGTTGLWWEMSPPGAVQPPVRF